jgi:hypothetical protein
LFCGGGTPGLEISLNAEFMVFVSGDANTSFGVFTDTLFEEIGFFLEGDRGHDPRERVGYLRSARLLEEGNQKAIGAELNVLGHQVLIHTEEANRESLTYELAFNVDSVADDLANALGTWFVEEAIAA